MEFSKIVFFLLLAALGAQASCIKENTCHRVRRYNLRPRVIANADVEHPAVAPEVAI
jgi:hypothetical protein